MDIERLRTDPAYWDEVAPEGATHCDPGRFMACWYRRNEGQWEYYSPCTSAWMRSRNRAPFFDRLKARPTEWRGPEDGLPPVGLKCLARRLGSWVECEIVAHAQSDGVTEAIYQCATDWGWSATGFRPLKSDKERVVEAVLTKAVLMCVISVLDYPEAKKIAGGLYDAGLLKLPEGTGWSP